MATSPLHNEPALLKELAAGNRDAFETIYRDRYLPLFHFIKQLVGDQQAAEDIATDTLLKLWNKRTDFEQFGKLNTFLFTVARNACYNWMRDEKRHAARHKTLLHEMDTEEQPNLAEQEIAVLVYQYIFSEIAKLPEKMRSVLRLHLEGQKNETIARELGLAEKTVRNLKTEAVKTLRLRLSDKEFSFLLLLLGTVRYALC